MIFLKNNSEIEKLYCAGQIVKETLLMLEEHIVPGVTTLDLDKLAEEFILSKKSKPGFKVYMVILLHYVLLLMMK